MLFIHFIYFTFCLFFAFIHLFSLYSNLFSNVFIYYGEFILNSLRKHAYSKILKISPPKTENFSDKNSDTFHISA